MHFKKHILFVLAIILLATQIHSQSPDQLLPFDDSITIGHLENGLTYYIKQNSEPKDMAYLFLVCKVGSIDENDDQRGLAHFLEHSAFNGTENFPGNSLREYLNSVGSGLMGGTNAMTSFDFTVYILETKTTDLNQLDKFFTILSDYSARLSLDNEAIDKERGIILEEKRLHSGAMSRMMDKVYEVLFWGSQYSVRLPIGTPEVIANFPYQTLKDFYHDWYRPDLQAVIAVGDFDPQTVESFIHKNFDTIPKRENSREKIDFEVPSHSDTKFAFVTDKEATEINLIVYYKSPARPRKTEDDYNKDMVVSLLNALLNKRFEDITRSPNPPFIMANASYHSVIAPMALYGLQAVVDQEHIMSGYEALFTEIQRVKQHGFHPSELENAKAIILTQYERARSEKDKTNSGTYAWHMMSHFTDGSQMMDIDDEYEIVTDILKNITFEDINDAIDTYLTDDNRAVVLMGPDTIDDILPDQTDLLRLFDDISGSDVEPYAETVITEPLLAKTPKKAKVNAPTFDETLGIYTWTLKNGAKVHLKTTDFKNNEIHLSAFRTGGLSQADDAVHKSARFADGIQNASGLGQFDAIQLSTYLSGKDLRFYTSLGGTSEQISARSSIKDFETMLQMMYINATKPRFDETAFEVWRDRQEILLRNQANSPQFLFSKTMSEMLFENHPRNHLETAEDVVQVNHRTAYNFYKSRFDSANGFNFVFVGNITASQLQPYIETYIATLPKGKAKTDIVDRKLKISTKQAREDIYKGQEMSLVASHFTNRFPISWETEQKIRLMNAVFQEMLFDNIREKMSGVYIVQTAPIIIREYGNQLSNVVLFGSDKDRVEEILTEIKRQIHLLLFNEYDELFFTTAKETLKKEYEQNERENRYWLSTIQEMLLYGFTSFDVARHTGFVDTITREDVAAIANRCFDLRKNVTVVLFPEEGGE